MLKGNSLFHKFEKCSGKNICVEYDFFIPKLILNNTRIFATYIHYYRANLYSAKHY